MTEKRNAFSDEELLALKTLQKPDASESETEHAFAKLASLLPKSGPSSEFSVRVMAAVRQLQLPAGRRPLRARLHLPVIAGSAGLGAAAVATLMIMDWTAAEIGVARMVSVIIQTALLLAHSLHFTFDAWGLAERTGQLSMVVITATPMLTVLLGMAVLSGLSLAGLTRLVSSSQREFTK